MYYYPSNIGIRSCTYIEEYFLWNIKRKKLWFYIFFFHESVSLAEINLYKDKVKSQGDWQS